MGRKLAGAAPPWPAAAGNTTDAVDVSLGGGAAGLGGGGEACTDNCGPDGEPR